MPPEQESELERTRAAFVARFGRRPELALRAPGRVNLIGEHTDYNEGLVLPCAIDRDTLVLAAPRGDRRVRAVSLQQEGAVEFGLDRLARAGDWGDYVRGAAAGLAGQGHGLAGADLLISSRVPLGSGLSSSAALCVAAALALSRAAGLELPPRAIAEAAHAGESRFVGVGCGILDPFASALGRRDHALRIDCRDRSVEPVPLGAGRIVLLIAHSGVTRTLAGAGYRERVAQCAAALAAAKAAGLAAPQARSLRELAAEQLPALERALDPVCFRRARHVIRENQRVDAFRAAVVTGDLAAAGALLREGMVSLREDYGVSIAELDLLCALGDAAAGCYGSRLTGAGFGGCTLHLVEPAAAEDVAREIRAGFARSFGREPVLFGVRPADGASALAL
jgi:galactokinase